MPIREYQAASAPDCDYCRRGFEVLEAVQAPPERRCPRCGAPVRRLISAPRVGGSRTGFDERARRAGFGKFKRLGRGEYERHY